MSTHVSIARDAGAAADLWLPLCHPIEVMRAIPLQPVMQCGEWRKSGAQVA